MGNGFLLIVVGLLLFYLVISDKFKCLEGFAGCVTGLGSATAPNATPTVTAPLPTLPNPATIQSGYPNLSINTNWGYGI